MNKQRRKELADILNELAGLRSRLESVQSDEQDAYDNMPESFQEGERGERAQEVLSLLDDAVTAFDEIDSALSEAQE